jgi:nitrogen-specific signal transduction histidine kinase
MFTKKIKPISLHIIENDELYVNVSSSDISDSSEKKCLSELDNYKLNVKSRIHDIKTPLNNIVLSVNSEEHISEENKLNIIENAYMIKDLLNDLLKNENNLEEFQFKPKKIHISKLTKKIEYLMLNEFKSYDKVLTVDILDLECEYFYGDEKLVIRLLSNLIKNSLKYKSETFTPIRLIIENILNQHTLVTNIVIIDNNDELPEEIRKNIFKPYNTTNNSGLGLYICKRIVDLHNANIEYKRIDNTNNFLITFKNQMLSTLFQDTDSSTSDREYNVINKVKKMVSKSQFDLNEKKKILLIDDCLVTLKLMKFIINKIDKTRVFEVNTLSHISKDFYSEVNKQKLVKYDIIVTDYHIGNYICTELLDILMNANYKGKIYCITGNEDQQIVNELTKRRIHGVYFKPINYENITNILNLDPPTAT